MNRPSRWLWLVVVLYLALATAYAVYTPAWQAPDEPAHYNYVSYVAEEGRLPVLAPGDYPAAYLEEIKARRFPADMSIAPLRYEAHQPPLYYLLAAGVYRLAAWAGARFEKGDEQGNLMPGTLCSVWAGIDWDAWYTARPKGSQPDGHMLEEAFADGVFTVRDEHLTGMHRTGEHTGGGNIGHTFDVDGTDEVSLTKALVWGRRSMKEYLRYYSQYLKGFENLQLVATGSLLGIRETRRIQGDYVLALDDYQRRASFPDEIGRYAYPIDNHPLRPGKDTYEQHRKEFDETLRYAKGESYGIPYRVLTPRGLDNVLVAGRCVSADRMVHGSIRVMPACFITGQAAGVAAAMAAGQDQSTHQIDTRQLQQRLKALGGYLPNA